MPLNGITATVFNGSGFIGRNLIARLGKIGCQVVIGYRGSGYDEFRLRVAGGLGQIYFAEYDMRDEKSLREAMQHSDVVINATGKENETKNFSFDDVHVHGPRKMAKIAKECGVDRFIHFSSLNADPNPEPKVLKNGSQFLQSKYYGELAVKEEFPDAIIFRPADVIGEKDNFINHFTALQRSFYRANIPLYDYYFGVEKQPILIQDIVEATEKAIFDESAKGKTFQLVGPHRYNFFDLIIYMKTAAGNGINENHYARNLRFDPLMRICMAYWERFSKYPFLTWERVEKDMNTDKVFRDLPTTVDLGVVPTKIEPEVELLCHNRPRLHRVNVPYSAKETLDRPARLDLLIQ